MKKADTVVNVLIGIVAYTAIAIVLCLIVYAMTITQT